jgi:acyl carrier protein phosphodiesterase
MNYLAHLYLSGNNEKVMIGNFIGDFVKGKKWEEYTDQIGQGILLHRKIDSFTDSHPKFIEARLQFKPVFGLYSGIIIDFLYDHYLAKNWNTYSNENLHQFTKHTHKVLLKNFLRLPAQVQQFLPFLIKNKRLESYATIDGIIEAVGIMSKYSSLPNKPAPLKKIWMKDYQLLEENFTVFMPDLISFSNSVLKTFQNKTNA